MSKYRKDAMGTGSAWLKDVPVWVAVETFSLGTLSKAITYRNDGGHVYACLLYTSDAADDSVVV